MGYHLSSTVPRLARRSIPAVEAELQALPPPSPRLDRPPPDSATALRDAFRLDKTVLLFGLLMHSAAQWASLLNWTQLPLAERAQRLASILLIAAYGIPLLWAPRFYARWRTSLLVLQRLAFFAFPLLRQPKGAVHHVLDRPPREGVLGAAFDFLRICWGARLFAAAMASVITPIPLLPPAPHLLLQIYTVAMIHPLRNKSLCASRLLSHPLTAGRLQLVHSWLHLVAAIPAVVLNGAHPPSGNPQQECEEVLSFLSLSVGLLLPLLLVVKTEPASSLERWEAAQRALGLECSSSEASTSSEASGGGGHASDGARRTSGMGPRLARAWRWAEARIEEGMRLLAGRSWLAPRPPRRPISRLEELQRHRPYADVFLTPEQLHALDSLARRLDGGSGNGGGGSPAQLNAWQRLVLWWLVLSLAFVLSLVSPGWPGAPAQAAH